MNTSDLDAVVKVHRAAFPGFFLTRMGPRFLRAYYQAVMDYKASIALVAYDSEIDGTLGFAVGFNDPQGFYALFGQRRKRLFPAILLAVLCDPALLSQILLNVRRVEVQGQQPIDAVELSSIAVIAPGRGIGGMLLEAFADKARCDGARSLILTTDAEGNDSVRRFYEERGFTFDEYHVRGERLLCRYVRSLG